MKRLAEELMQRWTWLSSYWLNSPELSSNSGVDEEIGGGVDAEMDVAELLLVKLT
jgi:hypothetical protein